MTISTPMSIPEFDDLMQMLEWMDHVHPQGFSCTRDGMRLGIAALEDEAHEVWEEWEKVKRTIDHPDELETLNELRTELLQVAAVAMRMVRSIDTVE